MSLAITDLPTCLSINSELIQVLSAEPAVWPDSSLSCPRPGEVYTQQTVIGYQVWLEVNDQQYEYRSDTDETTIPYDSTFEANGSIKDTDLNIDDGWPNGVRDKDVMITPSIKKRRLCRLFFFRIGLPRLESMRSQRVNSTQ